MRHYFNPSAQPTPQLFTIHYSLFTGAAGRETRPLHPEMLVRGRRGEHCSSAWAILAAVIELRCPSGDLLGDDHQSAVGAGIFAGGKAQKPIAVVGVNAGVVQRKGFALGDKIGKFFF